MIANYYEKEFWEFVYERQEMYHKRFVLKQPKPWTNNTILAKYHFTNVYPELDRGSIYIQNQIVMYAPIDIFFRIVVYRLFNRIETFEQIKQYVTIDNFDAVKMSKILKEYQAQGNAITTSAFMITGAGKGTFKKHHNKIDIMLFDVIESDIHKNVVQYFDSITNAKSLQEVHKVLDSMKYVGDFLAYVILFDLCKARVVKFSLNEWVNVGIGARKALKIMYPNVTNTTMMQNRVQYLRDYQDVAFKELNLDFKYYKNQRLTLADIEWCLCEFSKYLGAKYGMHHSKLRNFVPRTKVM